MMGESEGVETRARRETVDAPGTEATSKVCRRHPNGVLTVEGRTSRVERGSRAGERGATCDVGSSETRTWKDGRRGRARGCIGAGDALDEVGKTRRE